MTSSRSVIARHLGGEYRECQICQWAVEQDHAAALALQRELQEGMGPSDEDLAGEEVTQW